jgi:lipopolysaccharide transport system permease protein
MARMRLKADAKKMVLSYIWWALEPLMYAGMFYLVFTYLRSSGNDHFFIFLMLGKIPYLWFAKGATSASTSISANKGLISLRPISKWIFPMVVAQETLYKQVVAFIVLIVLVLADGFWHLSFWWQLIPLILIQYLLICGLGMIFSIFVTYSSDFGMLINMLMLGLMFSSGVFMDLNQISDPVIKDMMLLYNPLAALINAYRQVLMLGQGVEWIRLLPTMFITVSFLLIGITSLNYLDSRLTRRLFS